MKLAWIINLYPPYIMGGNEIIAYDIVSELRARGHQVYLLTGCGRKLQDPFHLTPVNFDLERMEERFLGTRAPTLGESFRWHIYDQSTHKATIQALRQIRPDLTIVDNFSLISVAPLLAAVHAKSKVVVQANDKWLIYGLKVPGQGLWHCPRWQRPPITIIQRLVQPIFSHTTRRVPIIVNSHFMKEAFIRAGFEMDKLEVVHLGIDVNTFRPNTDRAQIREPIRLVFGGALWEGKGPQVAIRALAHLKKQAPQMRFVLSIYGEGKPEFKDYLSKLAMEMGVNDLICYSGFVSPTELAEAFRTHDLFLFTSIWDEPFSLTLLSAMSCGIPVISTSAGGSPEAIENGHTGLIVPPGDPVALAGAILELAEDPALRHRLSTEASAAVREKWSFEHYVDTLEALYQAYSDG